MKQPSAFAILCFGVALLFIAACSSGPPRQSLESVPARGSWSMKAPMPIEIGEVTVTAVGGKVYVIGGSTGDVVDQKLNQEYDIATNTWRERAPLKSPRGSVGITVLNGKIHAIGGRGVDKVTVTTHEVYDPATNRWTKLAPLPKARIIWRSLRATQSFT